MNTRLLVSLAACLLMCALPVLAEDWPQWQGPDRNNVSKEKGLLQDWPKEGPKLLWTFENAGAGYSGPSIVGDRLYCQGADNKEFVFAVDVKTGKRLWATEYSTEYKAAMGDGPRSNPTVDGNRIYALGSQGELVCLGTDGQKVWQKNLKKDCNGQMMSGWGYSESPLVDGDKVVCTPGGKDGTMAAFNKKTGELLWRSKDVTDAAGYSSIVAADMGGVHQYVQLTGQSVIGIAAEDGRKLWQYARRGPTAAIPTPIVQDNYVWVTSDYGAPCNLIKITADGKTFKVEEVYVSKSLSNQHGGVALVGDHVYGHSGGNGPPHNWVCLDFKTGKPAWEAGNDKLPKGSLTCADGRLYCYSQDNGTVVLLEPTPKAWTEHGRFKIPRVQRGGSVWTHPVVATGKLFLRDQNLLYCYDVHATN
jgi:outer membrane protein assembly factor BamB